MCAMLHEQKKADNGEKSDQNDIEAPWTLVMILIAGLVGVAMVHYAVLVIGLFGVNHWHYFAQ